MEGTDNPMVKAADKVAEAFVLFAQVPLLLMLLFVAVNVQMYKQIVNTEKYP